jgi:serine 3-dehydrogenase
MPLCLSLVSWWHEERSDQAASDRVYGGANPMTAEDIAEQLFWIATLPPHLNINRLEIMPVTQSFPAFQVHRH